MWPFRKNLTKVLSSLTTLTSDLEEIITDETKVQADIVSELAEIEEKREASIKTATRASTVLLNVETLLNVEHKPT